jgi:hypothetical protein
VEKLKLVRKVVPSKGGTTLVLFYDLKTAVQFGVEPTGSGLCCLFTPP